MKNPFRRWDLKGRNLPDFAAEYSQEIQRAFEEGQVLIFDNYDFATKNFLLNFPSKAFPDWVAPISGARARRRFSEDHPFKDFYDEPTIQSLQSRLDSFESDMLRFNHAIFANYEWAVEEFSYRFNELGLGFLHLDVPDQIYFEHQLRLFVNLDWKPRILAFGPRLEDLAAEFWEPLKLGEIARETIPAFIGELRARILDGTDNRFRELPRHYMTLDPGAIWISHASLISHGVVWGRKTACLEGHVVPASMLRPHRAFSHQVADIIEKHAGTRPTFGKENHACQNP